MASEISAKLPPMLTWEGGKDAPTAKNTLGKDDFMKLLMTQLRYQDPLKPMDHEQFAAQLAQFGSLEQLSNIGTGIQGLKTGLGEGAKLQALGMIGKQVQASSNQIDLKDGGVVIPRPAQSDLTPAKVTIFGQDGNLVRELDLSGKRDEEITWDGKNQDGGTLPPGKYSFRVHGVGQNGQMQEIGAGLSGRVTGVEMEGAVPTLIVQTESGSQKVELAKVTQVKLDENEAKQPSRPVMPAGAPLAPKAPLVPQLAAEETGGTEERAPLRVSLPETEPDPADREVHGFDVTNLVRNQANEHF